ncbi:unnamed protein product [Cuscuta epithymum]|uniref:Uncharacterized protein n=1 Tax=Cuscuta epithymum TaxID=186058 RepID=A0AAV0DY30_9ASTE|nr:unnamed protein product [Cuscuta epithymum]
MASLSTSPPTESSLVSAIGGGLKISEPTSDQGWSLAKESPPAAPLSTRTGKPAGRYPKLSHVTFLLPSGEILGVHRLIQMEGASGRSSGERLYAGRTAQRNDLA